MSNRISSSSDSLGVSRDSSRVEFTDLNFTEQGSGQMQREAQGLDRFQLYQPFFRTQLFNTTLGNNGNAFQQLNYNQTFNRGFNWGFRTLSEYTYQPENMLFYDAQSPYTRAMYVQGSKQENYFELLHTQNVGKALNFGLEYQRINSEGFFTRQTAAHTAIRMHVWLRPQNSRYNAMLGVVYHKGVSQENGGLTPTGDTLYREGLETNFKLLPIWLNDARNKVFQNGGILRQTFDLTGKRADSLKTKGGVLRLQHTAIYGFQRHAYDDESPDTNYYSTIYNTGVISTAWVNQRFVSESAIMRLSFKPDTSKGVATEFKAFIRQQWNSMYAAQRLNGDSVAINVFNQSAGGFFRFRNRKLRLQGDAEVFFSGYNAGDVRLGGTLWLKPASWMAMTLQLESFIQEPDYQYQRFVSNFGSWANSFDKINHLKLAGRLAFDRLNLSLNIANQTTGNFIYVDSMGRPQQSGQVLNVLSAALQHRLRVGKFHLHSSVLWQQNNLSDVLRLPDFQFQESLFFETKIKRSKTDFRLGVDLTGCTAFVSAGYMPYSGLFYLQNTDSNAGLMQFDVYMSVKIRRVRFFAKAEHANSSFQAGQFEVIPFYPIASRALKFGLSWVFFD